jgi:RNA 2',3'-cyclic 3'-phosphodiesterase
MTSGRGDKVSTTCVSGWANDSRNKADKSWRVFIAIELTQIVRARLAEHIDRLRATMPEVRASWSREGNLHLTLKFLGDIPVTNVEQLSAAASIAAVKVEPFEIVVEGCGAFPPRGQPRVLWIGIDDPSGKLAELNRALEDECANAGFPREPRAFHPHLTIVRLRQPQGSRQMAAKHEEIGFNREIVGVSGISVIRSELRSEGSKHTTISRHGFSLSME